MYFNYVYHMVITYINDDENSKNCNDHIFEQFKIKYHNNLKYFLDSVLANLTNTVTYGEKSTFCVTTLVQLLEFLICANTLTFCFHYVTTLTSHFHLNERN